MGLKKTCFVVSPIGDKGSEVRSQADAFYDLIIEPALEKFDFEVTRADKNTSVSSITSEIVKLVQESDLCIIDITGQNANVMYECGRRHETAKPYIMMAKEGERLPFDISSIRTIFYIIDDPREIRNSVKNLQAIISKMLEYGFEPERSGESLSSLSDTMTRIERKIDRLSLSGTISLGGASTSNVSQFKEILESLGGPDAFRYAVGRRDADLVDFLLPVMAKKMSAEKYDSIVLPLAASVGSDLARKLMEERLPLIETFDRRLQRDYVGSIVSRLIDTGRSAEGLELLGHFFESIVSTDAPNGDLSVEDKAFLVNQYQKLLYSAGRASESLEYLRLVLQLVPNDLVYMYNYMLVCDESDYAKEAYGMAIKLFQAMKERQKYNHDHLAKIIEIFKKEKDAGLKDAFAIMQEVNKLKAEFLMEDDELRYAILA